MSDLLTLLPNVYQTSPSLRSLLDRHSAALEQCNITTVDLVSLDPRTICRRARISLNDVNKIVDAVRDALNAETMGLSASQSNAAVANSRVTRAPSSTPTPSAALNTAGSDSFRGRNMEVLGRRQMMVEFGDEGIDRLLNGGAMTGSLTEIVGESGVGKTQLLLRLCFSIQQPPHNRTAIYICTESQISTRRMESMLRQLKAQQVPGYQNLSMDRIQTAMCQYLETLEHIVRYQLPVAIERFDVGLVIVDSIAANFRVEDEASTDSGFGLTTPTPKGKGPGNSKARKLAKRAGDIVRLGTCLKEMAVKHNIAVVVANQVSDLFEPAYLQHQRAGLNMNTNTSMSASMPPLPSSAVSPPTPTENPRGEQIQIQTQVSNPGSQDAAASRMTQYSLPTDESMMTYDYQAKWFTGWGDDMDDVKDETLLAAMRMKTPMLGMSWTNLLDGRIALLKGSPKAVEGVIGADGEGWEQRTRRWMKVVFSPWAESAVLLEYEIWEGGVRSLKEGGGENDDEDELGEF
ncbi:hypothetical protein H072_5040 [Dactylellina haptotyla CBS 200.50]|uniref:RecA family profile 1 domain-containing protein n=1 Tax=Dactylellina haptotyla (strain CBS 200.50) TaxID=1284197 RepID=S8ADI4_DACHA|nr:hypothetical protein H072_5040 [Dactylellina haptotyla CBS 200.50]